MNDTGYEVEGAEAANKLQYNVWDPAEGIWNMVLSELLRKGSDIRDAIVAANKAVAAHRELFKGN